MINSIFNEYGRFYDLLYSDKNYAGEVAYVLDLLDRFGLKKGHLLEFGSGTGKHGRLLATHGYTVHGIERSAAMVSQADLATSGFSCAQGDICDLTLGRKFDAVLALFHVISYQVTNGQLLAVFKNAAAHLNHKGLFIFDFWYTPAVHSLKPSIRVKRIADDEVEITRIAEPSIRENENRVDIHYTIYARNKKNDSIQIFHETHAMRHFTLPEIDLLAQMSGFLRINAEEFLSKAAPGLTTWGVSVTLQRC